MPTIYLNEQDAGGPATSVAYPNLRTCVGVTTVLANATMVGGHLTAADDVTPVTGRMVAAIGTEDITRLYLIGGYTLVPGQMIHGGDQTAHAQTVASAFHYHGQVWSCDTAALGYLGLLVIFDHATQTGEVQVRYKDWEKLTGVSQMLDKGVPNPYKPSNPKVPSFITSDVVRKPKRNNPSPQLIMHDLDMSKFKKINV
jgi:hypothetical protein